jgi:hypothetical protein
MIKGLFYEVILKIQSWSIRKQMMLCYMLGLFIILILILSVLILNTFLMQQETAIKVQTTKDSEADQDLLDLSICGAELIYSITYGNLMSLNVTQNMLLDMFRPLTFALDYAKLYTDKDIPINSWTNDPSLYGPYNITKDYSTILYLNSTLDPNGQTLAKMASRFSYIWPSLLKIYDEVAIRYIMYFDTSNFVIFYPGIMINNYNPTQTPWYQSFLQTNLTTYTNSYPDKLGNITNKILSISIPLYDNKSNRIGVLSSDWLLSSIYEMLANITYLSTGYQYLVYKNGDILKTNTKEWINPDVTNLNNLTYSEFWPNVLSNPRGTHYLIEADDIWRVGSSPVYESSQDAWNFILLVVVRESDVISYKGSSKESIETQGIHFILITAGCSVFTSSIIFCFINFQSNNISRPIQGIIDFTYKLNSEETGKEVINELNNLEEGTDQIARLVLAYKSLAKNLINSKDSNSKPHQESVKVYPPNELNRINRDLLAQNLDSIPININKK